jgi:hypothetical protein
MVGGCYALGLCSSPTRVLDILRTRKVISRHVLFDKRLVGKSTAAQMQYNTLMCCCMVVVLDVF